MEASSQKKNNSNVPIIILIIVVIVAILAAVLFLKDSNKDDSNNSNISTEDSDKDSSKDSDKDSNKDEASDTDDSTTKVATSFEALGSTREEVQALINYDFNDYEVLGEGAEKYAHSFNALDTIITFIIYSDDPNLDVYKIFSETQDLVNAYESLVSKTVEGSFTYDLNKNGEYDYSNLAQQDIIHNLYDKSEYYAQLSGGALDITMEPVVRLWNINNGNKEVPSQADIDKNLALVNYNNFIRDDQEQKYKLLDGATVDFGSIAKGQIADLIKASLMSKGVDSALVNLGGNVMTIGEKPGGLPWIIAIQDPEATTGDYFATVEVKNKSVVTSGNYERFFIKDGVRYHHILNPATGYPANNGVISTTIISDHSIDCDALSTTTFILGEEKGKELINSLDGFESMFITDDIDYIYSDNFEVDYNLTFIE